MNDIAEMPLDIKSLVKNNEVEFEYFRNNIFFYCLISNGKKFFTFPVPLEDIQSTTLPAKDKALTFMRWIRKAMIDKTLIKAL